jgi:chromosome segregation ATPase
MKSPVSLRIIIAAAGMLVAGQAAIRAQDPAPERAQEILAAVKKSELDQQIAAKKVAVQRFAEDRGKAQKEVESLQQTINEISSAIAESSDTLSQLKAQRARLTQILELTGLRIEAERQKLDGLQLLTDAQSKALAAANRQIEEIDVRSGITSAEQRLLEMNVTSFEGAAIAKSDSSKLQTEIRDLKKKLVVNERNTSTARRLAREALGVANLKLNEAGAASARAKKRAADTPAEPVAEGPAADGEQPAASPSPAPPRATPNE